MQTKQTIKVRQNNTLSWEWAVEIRTWPDDTNTGDVNSAVVIPEMHNAYGRTMTRWGAVRQARRAVQYLCSSWEVVS